jgi:hypothetical protein
MAARIEGPLGRLTPPDFEHVEKYALSALPEDAKPVTSVPVAIGINWYEAFDQPLMDADGDFWIARNVPMGNIRGGHCVCLEPVFDPKVTGGEQDPREVWWEFYDQGQEGACVGFGCSRMMSLMNRKRYDAEWLYAEARKLDGTYPADDGTYVRSALAVIEAQGHVVQHVDKKDDKPRKSEGINTYRWATTADEVLGALGTPGLDYVTILNSWGKAYPHRVKLQASVLQRLLDEAGEAGMVTDR